jgi:hypothetical protein
LRKEGIEAERGVRDMLIDVRGMFDKEETKIKGFLYKTLFMKL